MSTTAQQTPRASRSRFPEVVALASAVQAAGLKRLVTYNDQRATHRRIRTILGDGERKATEKRAKQIVVALLMKGLDAKYLGPSHVGCSCCGIAGPGIQVLISNEVQP